MKKSLVFVIIFQALVLLSLLLYAYLPLYFGKEIQIRASGYDPRDPFLGSFTALTYDIGSLYTQKAYEKNHTIFLSLKKDKTIYVADTISKTKPSQGLFLKGRVRFSYKEKGETRYKTFLKFGIERYFSTRKKAKILENKLRDINATVTIKVLFGIPRIQSIQIDN